MCYYPNDFGASRVKKQRANFSHYPLAFLALAFAGGIAVSSFIALELSLPLGVAVILAVTALAVPRRLSPYVLTAAFFALGAFCFQAETKGVAENRIRRLYDEGRLVSGEPVEIEGVLGGMPEPAYNGSFIFLKIERYTIESQTQAASGGVKIFCPEDSPQAAAEFQELHLRYGTRIRVAVRLKREDEYSNPGVFRRTKILDQKGVDAVGTIKSPLMIERLGDDRVFLPLAWIYEQRARSINEFHETFSTSTAGVLIASLLGDKNFLDQSTANAFREGGTFHVLVISGLHITFMGALALFLIRLFIRIRLWQFLIADAFLWSYTFAVGAEVPVVRATVMFTILSFSYVIYRQGTLLNSLGFSALLLLTWQPSDLFTASFQLTFASVGAIVLIGFPLVGRLREIGTWSPTGTAPFPPAVPQWQRSFCEMLYWRKRVWRIQSSRNVWTGRLFKSPYFENVDDTLIQKLLAYLFEGLLISVFVQLWMLPLAVVYFHRATPASVLLNLWVGLLIAVESISAVLAVAARQLSDTIAIPLVHLTEFINWLIVMVPGLLSNSDLAGTRIPNYSGLLKAVYFVYYVPLIAISLFAFGWDPFRSNSRRQLIQLFIKLCVAVLVVSGTLILFHPFSAPTANGRLMVEFLDVGQGDSALVTFPDGETMLIDGGGRPRFEKGSDEGEPGFEPDAATIGESVVSQFLWGKGYSRIDHILATHADADHIQGLTAVASNFRVRTAFFGRMPADDPDLQQLADVLQKREIPAIIVGRNDRFNIGGVDVKVLSPIYDDSRSSVSDNNHSVVLLMSYGDRRFLFTGDIERDTEELLSTAPNELRADVVKVPHHGSGTSSTQAFVSSVAPSIAVFSVGRHSIFGHPNRQVIERWKAAGSRIFQTGTSGTVTISTDGEDLRSSTFLDPH